MKRDIRIFHSSPRLSSSKNDTQCTMTTFGRYEGELLVQYDSGEATAISLSASAEAVEIYLSMPNLQLEPAYIGLCRFEHRDMSL